MARIYLGRAETDLGGERLLVIKQILPLLASSAEFSQLLIDEAKLAARLAHGNIAQVIDLGREGVELYIAMEYVEGFDLRELLRHCSKGGVPLPVEFSLLILVETLRALDYAHRKRNEDLSPLGLVHRDVSPSNVLLSFEGEVKLCDFGIARAMGVGANVPEEAIQGKAGYMSPEAARGETLDARSDVFALGVIMWELLAGRRLYRGQDRRAPTLAQAMEALVPELPDRGYPEQQRLYGIVMKALAKDREQRYSSARDMQRDLEAYVASARLSASPLRFGEWLMDHFGSEIVERRRARELAAKSVDSGLLSSAPVVRTPADLPPPPSRELGDIEVPRLEPPPTSLQAMVDTKRSGSTRKVSTALVVAVLAALVAVVAYLMR